MAQRLKIEILSQPTPYQVMTFTIFTSDSVYWRNNSIVFMPGPSIGLAGVEIGPTLADTVSRLFARLSESFTDTFTWWSLESGAIYLNFYEPSTLNLSYVTQSWLNMELVTVSDTPVVLLQPFELGSLSLEIIDTYDNDRPLVEEMTQANAPMLKYDGGDDIYEPFMASTLDFNLLVNDASDAKFSHLFTGDENRYKVRLTNTDPDDVQQLIWQGYLLPDQYKEPYKNGVFFVSFTAVDMISTLKGKYLDPWLYYARYTLPEIISMLLKMTGLEQRITVKPSIVNSSPLIGWRNIIVNLEPFIKDGKPSDAYKILESVLISQCLSLSSYRGERQIEGFTRRGELEGPVQVYGPDGEYLGTGTATRQQVDFEMQADSPNLNSITPFKTVDIDFSFDEKKNLFPDDVVIRDSFFAGYNNDAFDRTTPTTTYFNQWKKTGGGYLDFIKPTEEFSFKKKFPGVTYNVYEAESLANYYECPVKPYVSPGRVYEFEFEVNLRIGIGTAMVLENFMNYLNGGEFDKWVIFQMLLNGSEIRSNRPSSPTLGQNKYDDRQYVSYDINQGTLGIIIYNTTFRIKREFTVADDGYITFRMLAPRFTGGQFTWRYFEITPKILKINVVEGAESENISAKRDINFTQTKDLDLPITCSVNSAVPNSFRLGDRVGNTSRDIPMVFQEDAAFYQIFPPINNLRLDFRKMMIPTDISAYLFDKGNTKAVYLQKADGSRVHFYSLYVRQEQVGRFLYSLTDWEGRPRIPKDYKRLPVADTGDQLKIHLSDFTEEDFSKREFWKVYGLDSWVENYPRTVANAYHCTRKDPVLNLETGLLGLMFPDQVYTFYFDGQDRKFLPTRLELDLTGGKTQMNSKEYTINQIDDITYE